MDTMIAAIWDAFFEAIWHHRPTNGSSVGALYYSPPEQCQRTILRGEIAKLTDAEPGGEQGSDDESPGSL